MHEARAHPFYDRVDVDVKLVDVGTVPVRPVPEPVRYPRARGYRCARMRCRSAVTKSCTRTCMGSMLTATSTALHLTQLLPVCPRPRPVTQAKAAGHQSKWHRRMAPSSHLDPETTWRPSGLTCTAPATSTAALQLTQLVPRRAGRGVLVDGIGVLQLHADQAVSVTNCKCHGHAHTRTGTSSQSTSETTWRPSGLTATAMAALVCGEGALQLQAAGRGHLFDCN